MHARYEDITSRIAAAPSWYDETGVPRWGPFHPRLMGNIYVQQAVLLEIACQGCGHMFEVAMSRQDYWSLESGTTYGPLDEAVRMGRIHYGDPPNIDCCAAGPSMNSIPQRIIQFWAQDLDRNRNEWRDWHLAGEEGEFNWSGWYRVPELEVEVEHA